MRRAAFALLLALLVALPTFVFAEPASAQTGFVTWTVNHRFRTIKVKAKLSVYGPSCAFGQSGGVSKPGCWPLDKIAREIQRDIEATWNGGEEGRHYRCYRVLFSVDINVVPSQGAVPADRVGIRVDQGAGNVRSDTTVTLQSGLRSKYGGNYLSNDPSDRLEPSNNPLAPSTWAYPPISKHTYAHEFGHVLGLDDHYVEGTNELREGAPADLMWNQDLDTISQETIDRVVERNRDRLKDTRGRTVDLDELICDFRYRATLQANDVDHLSTYWELNLSGEGCDPPSVQTLWTSTDQLISVRSRPVEVHLVDAWQADTGYSLAGVPDVLRSLWGLQGRFETDPAGTAFAMPIVLRIDRQTQRPGRGERPELRVFPPESCSEPEPRGPRPEDCGWRTLDGWIAAVQRGETGLWTGDPPVPMHLLDIGARSSRGRATWRNCTGPDPWPGDFIDDPDAVTTLGRLPSKDDLERVSREWAGSHTPGRFDISGQATLETREVGRLRTRSYTWTITLCPLDKAGQVPPLCP